MRQYIGARYVPTYYQNSLDPTSSEWEANVQYDPLTIVSLPNLHSYQSKKFVPANIGSPASNPEYWYDQGYANAYFQALQDQIDDMKDGTIPGSLQDQIDDMKDGTIPGSLQDQINDNTSDITALTNDIAPIAYDIVVAADGSGDYISLTDAVTAASDGAKIFVKKGTYDNESVDCHNKTLIIIGDDSGNVTIKNSYDDYYQAPIEIASGYVKNLRFLSTGIGGNTHAYGAHVDYDIMAGKTLTFDNCYFESKTTFALGVGTRNHSKLILKDCELIGASASVGALFIHSSTNSSDYGSDQQAIFINCRLYSLVQQVISMQSVGTSDNNLYLTFLGCMLNTSTNNKTNLIDYSAYQGATGNVIIMAGAGNNYGVLNQQEYSTTITTIGKYGDFKSIKKAIYENTLVANTAKNTALPNDCEKVLEFNVLVKESGTGFWLPAGGTVPGTSRSSEAFYINEGGNKSFVVQSSGDGQFIATIVYISSNTANL